MATIVRIIQSYFPMDSVLVGIFFGRVVAFVLGGAGGAGGGTDAFVRFRSSDIFDRVYALHA
jgi:hypothetical protein